MESPGKELRREFRQQIAEDRVRVFQERLVAALEGVGRGPLRQLANVVALDTGANERQEVARRRIVEEEEETRVLARTALVPEDERRHAALADLNLQIDTLKKRKEFVDARIAFKGTSASEGLLAEKTRIDAQLNLLKSKQDLVKAQQTADMNVGTAKLSEEVQSLKAQVDIEKLKVQLEQLRVDLEALKKK